MPLLDLLLIDRGRRFGGEIKRMDARSLTGSMRIALANHLSPCRSAPFASSKVFERVISVFRGIRRALTVGWMMHAEVGVASLPPRRGDRGKTVRITARLANIPRDKNVLLATVASSIS